MAHGHPEGVIAACGCAAGEGDARTAVGVDSAVKDRNIKRLRRIGKFAVSSEWWTTTATAPTS